MIQIVQPAAPTTPTNERLVKAKSDGSISSSNPTTDNSAVLSKLKSKSLEPLTGLDYLLCRSKKDVLCSQLILIGLAMWTDEILTIELQKTERGLGFSILDYQDPLNPTETVIVIRSLVPGGVAQQDGRLIPGDRLMFVNNVPLGNASLDTAVQALKGAAQGTVRIGVSKPLPVTDSQITETETDGSNDNTEVRSTISDMETDPAHSKVERNDSINRLIVIQSQFITLRFYYSDIADLPPPLPTSPLPDDDEDIDHGDRSQASQLSQNSQSREQSEEKHLSSSPTRNTISIPNTERLIGGVGAVGGPAKSMTVETRYEERTDADNIPPLPQALEQKIKINKDADTLGVQVDIEEGGVNGMVVRSVTRGGTLARDGRIQPGDYLVAVNNENMRGVSHSQALAVLRRAQTVVLGEEIPITYIPASDAVVFRTSALTKVACGEPVTDTEAELRRSRSKSLDRKGATIININQDDPDIPPISSPPSSHHSVKAPLVSPENDISQSDVSAGVTANMRSFDKLSLRSVTTDESSTDPDQTAPLTSPPLPVTRTPPEAAPRTSLKSDSRPGSAKSMTLSGATSPSSPSKHWGPERTVEIARSSNQGLGISIVGGKVEPSGSGDLPALTGIFIKNVLEGSPAAALGCLNTGDRILAVGDVDLRTASHDMAVEAIRQAGNPLKLTVQSLNVWAVDTASTDKDDGNILDESTDQADESGPQNLDRTVGGEELVYPDSILPPVVQDFSPRKVTPPEAFKSFLPDQPTLVTPPTPSPRTNRSLELSPEEEVVPKTIGSPETLSKDNMSKTESMDSDMTTETDSDEVEQQGQETLSNGVTIDRASAAFITKADNDPEVEDEYGYTGAKIEKRYGKMEGRLIYVRLNKGTHGLGISLSGHKDRAKMSVMVAGLNPQGNAARDGQMMVGDIILEVNGLVLHNRCHLNASTVIKHLPDAGVTFILLRNETGADDVAVKPITQFPNTLEENAIDRYRKYKGLRQVLLKKGESGLGIMIIEGKHQEAGTGVFISDLKEGSEADKAGLLVGDMILAVNNEDFVGASYETAAKVLRKAEGEIKIIVANPNLPDKNAVKVDGENGAPVPTPTATSPEKPKIAPKPAIAPKPMNIASGSKIAEKAPTSVTAIQIKEKIDPTKCDITPGQDTTIEIIKDKDEEGKPMGLGLSIVGGSDTLLGAIFIHEVYEAGAAHKDGRLRPGDQILEVMKEDLRNVTHSFALHALRQTPNRVRLVIHREDDEVYEQMDVELVKKRDRGLGLSIVGKKSGPGVFISEVVKGGAADIDGRLVQGDQIISVNGNDLKNASQEEAAPVLKNAQGRIVMVVRRLKVGNRGQPRGDQSLPPNVVTQGTPNTVTLVRGQHGLGFSIVGGFGSPHGDMPIFVKTVFEKVSSNLFIHMNSICILCIICDIQGAAMEQGGLKRGDQILSVNNISLEGLTHQEAVNILKNCEGTVAMQILS